MTGKTIKLGTWNSETIEWLVLKEEGVFKLVLSKNPVIDMQLSTSGTWASTNFRSWLNEDFYTQAFTEKEKEKIVSAKLEDVNCKDNVFLLSKDEAETLMTQSERKRGNGSCAGRCYECLNCEALGMCWWLRTLHISDCNHFKVHCNYFVAQGGGVAYSSGTNLIRPAMYIIED